jgi:hypothetical protein
MTRAVTGILFAMVALAALPEDSRATYYTGTGAKASFRSATNVPLGTALSPNTLTTRITQATAGTVLTIQVNVAATGGTANYEPYILVYPGICAPEPMLGAGATIEFCHAGEYCVISMNYFCDVDKAEADNGGGVIGNPIFVTVNMLEYNSAPAGATVSWSVATRLEPKN